jgi:hypothetical protein
MKLLNACVDLQYIVKSWFVIFIKIFSFFAGKVLKTKWQSLWDSFWKEHVKITKQTTGKGTSDKHSSQWKYYQQLSFLTDVFTPRNMKSSIPPPDVDTIVADVNEERLWNIYWKF